MITTTSTWPVMIGDYRTSSFPSRLSCRATHADGTSGICSFFNLEVRDRYFSRLRATIELNLKINGKKTVLVSHSMGGPLLLVRAQRDQVDSMPSELTSLTSSSISGSSSEANR